MPPYPDGNARMAVGCFFVGYSRSVEVMYETDMSKLEEFMHDQDYIVGFNHKRFDLGLVLKNYFDTDPLQKKCLDLLDYIRKSGSGFATLQNLALSNLGKSKKILDVPIPIAWQQGREQEVITRCIVDAKLTYELFEVAQVQGYLEFEYHGAIIEAEINLPDDLLL